MVGATSSGTRRVGTSKDVVRIAWHQRQHIDNILILAEAHHAEQLTAICALHKLLAHQAYAVAVVGRVAHDKWLL